MVSNHERVKRFLSAAPRTVTTSLHLPGELPAGEFLGGFATVNFHTDGASDTFRTLWWALGQPRAIGEGTDTFTLGTRFSVSACNRHCQTN